MKTQHKLLTVKEVVQILVHKEVTSEKVAQALLIPRYSTVEAPVASLISTHLTLPTPSVRCLFYTSAAADDPLRETRTGWRDR
ncbi:hypothetical protein KYX88_16370, partial [Enterococcus faecium]|nr:hypothetical protein [Enterococcus faecium]